MKKTPFPITENWLRNLMPEKDLLLLLHLLQSIHKGKMFKSFRLYFDIDRNPREALKAGRILDALVGSLDKDRNNTIRLIDEKSIEVWHREDADEIQEDTELLIVGFPHSLSPEASEIITEMNSIKEFLSLDETELIQRL